MTLWRLVYFILMGRLVGDREDGVGDVPGFSELVTNQDLSHF